MAPDLYSPFLSVNQKLLLNKKFQQIINLADITPVYQGENATKVKNYRPVCALLAVSKIFDLLMQKQTSEYIKLFLSSFLCGYRKGFCTQTALVWLIEKWKHQLGKNSFTCALLMDLSMAFDTIKYDLVYSKLHVYGFGRNALYFVHSHLKNRKQRVKRNMTFSTWIDLILVYHKDHYWVLYILTFIYRTFYFFTREKHLQFC